MKLFALPIIRSKVAYYCYSIPNKQTRLSKATRYATKKWDNLSQAESSSWKYKIYVNGQKLLDRMDHQEYFLKGVPLKEELKVENESKVEEKEDTASEVIPLFYPSNIIKSEKIIMKLEELLENRLPYHRKYMIYSGMCLPLSATFTIVPIIPNIPFFYNVFRLYSHYKAFKGAQHLRHIINDKRLIPTNCEKLNQIYNGLNIENGNDTIDEFHIQRIAKEFNIEHLEVDVKRARSQILENMNIKSNNKKKENTDAKNTVVEDSVVTEAATTKVSVVKDGITTTLQATLPTHSYYPTTLES
ncbi:8540_t:CDS:2 [Diversispora eburnea]|uniref:8540_t:CDS:1 n=1 Tax=Diversispora eburnea TaxID=1213867 RepID=A0A9N9BIY7_9GLOM|nr:8540_t:CDS:2 [Diversispora eburnea]